MTAVQVLAYWPFALALLGTGVISGIMAGLLGIGGGAIIVPVLALVLGLIGFGGDVVQHVAVATSLAIIIPTGINSARSHHRRGAVDGRALRLWTPFIVAGTLVGGLMAGLFSGDVLRIVFGVMALFIALNIVLPFQKQLMEPLAGHVWAHRISALVVGYVSALMGVGGGSLSVPTLVAFGETMHKSVGTAAAIGVAIALSGTLGFVISGWGADDLPPFSVGFVNLPGVVLVGVTAFLFAPLGAKLAHSLDQRTLKYVFAIFLALVGAQMIWRAISG